MTSTQSQIAGAATQQALLSVSGLGSFVGPLKLIGDNLAKLFGNGNRLIHPFKKRMQGDPTWYLTVPPGLSTGDRVRWEKSAQGKLNRSTVSALEQWFNRMVTRPADTQAGTRFLEHAAVLRDQFPWAYSQMLPEVQAQLESVFLSLGDFQPTSAAVLAAQSPDGPPVVLQALEVTTNFVSRPTSAPGALSALELPPMSVRPSAPAAPDTLETSSGASETSTPASRPSAGVLFLFAALAAALILR